jgi:predicted metal-dependent peptidase
VTTTSVSASQNLISAALLRLRMKAPFFATLALFTRFISTQHHPTAATDGKDIYYNPDFLAGLRPAEQDGLLLHEVLHAALLHAVRRGVRDRQLWNIAADIIVNGIIAQQPGFALPAGGLRDEKLEKFSVEEAYELLQQEAQKSYSLSNPDLLDNPLEPSVGQEPNEESDDLTADTSASNDPEAEASQQSLDSSGQSEASQSPQQPETSQPGQLNLAELTSASAESMGGREPTAAQAALPSSSLGSAPENLKTHWNNALQQAVIIARTTQQGNLPAGFERELGEVTGAQLDWRSHLWRYLVQTPTDFQGFDRRFVHQGLYLEALQGESVQVYLCIDTSGSIDGPLLQLFLAEVLGILSAYPHLKCELYYADAAVYGPYELEAKDEIPVPQGGGGTSFLPFFEQVHERWDQITQGVCIYLTDGYGTFPEKLPELPVLWVVAPGGLVLESFPFGEAVRLLSIE